MKTSIFVTYDGKDLDFSKFWCKNSRYILTNAISRVDGVRLLVHWRRPAFGVFFPLLFKKRENDSGTTEGPGFGCRSLIAGHDGRLFPRLWRERLGIKIQRACVWLKKKRKGKKEKGTRWHVNNINERAPRLVGREMPLQTPYYGFPESPMGAGWEGNIHRCGGEQQPVH